MKLMILNGPNLDLLGIREPDHYGTETYAALCEKIRAHAAARGVLVCVYQSNAEGDLVERIHFAREAGYDGFVINPGALTHTSVSLLDALKAVKIPAVEVHISKVNEREDFRKISYIRPACLATVAGEGTDGYLHAMDLLIGQKSESGESV